MQVHDVSLTVSCVSYRKIKGILNRLTFQSFDPLFRDLLQIMHRDPDLTPVKISTLVVLEAIGSTPNIIPLFALLCQTLLARDAVGGAHELTHLLVSTVLQSLSDLSCHAEGQERGQVDQQQKSCITLAELYNHGVSKGEDILGLISQFVNTIHTMHSREDYQSSLPIIELLCTVLMTCGPTLALEHPIEVDHILLYLLEVVSMGPNHLKVLALNVGDLLQSQHPVQPPSVPEHQTPSPAMAPVPLPDPGGVVVHNPYGF